MYLKEGDTLKKLFLILILFTSSILSQWQTFNITSNIRFYDVCVVSQNVIWASGDSAKIYRTTNGGLSWQPANFGLPILPVLQITAINEFYAWINLGTRIFSTSNGGTSWTEQFYTPVTFINKIQFFNQNTGYIISDQLDSSVGFFVSRNGGANWIKSSNSPVLGNITSMWINDNGADALDTNFIWFVAKGSPSVYSRLYKLTGGLNNNWQVCNIGFSPSQCSYSDFINANTGLVSNNSGILITTNGGTNWSIQNSTILNDIGREVMIVPGTEWVIQTGMNNIRLSKDFSIHWQNTVTAGIYSFCDAKDTNSIWVAASGGRLLKYNINYIGINQISTNLPEVFKLHQNYPNPFNPETNIKFEIPESGIIKFRIFDVTGREVYSLSENRSAGIYSLNYNAEKLSSGIYYYSAEFNGKREVRKMIVLK